METIQNIKDVNTIRSVQVMIDAGFAAIYGY